LKHGRTIQKGTVEAMNRSVSGGREKKRLSGATGRKKKNPIDGRTQFQQRSNDPKIQRKSEN